MNFAKYVYLRLERVEGYEDVASELLIEDARCHPDFNPVDVTTEFERLEAGAQAVAKRCAEICDTMRAGTLAAQAGNGDGLSNVMLRQVAHLGHEQCRDAILAEFGLPAPGQGGG